MHLRFPSRLVASFQLRNGAGEHESSGQEASPAEAKGPQPPVVQVEYVPLGQSEMVRQVADAGTEGLHRQVSHVAYAVITEELVRSHAPAFQLPLQVRLLQPGTQGEAGPPHLASAGLLLDLASLLLGETECSQQWSTSSEHLPVPPELAQHISSACVTAHCCEYIQPESVDDPLEAQHPHPFLPPVLLTNLAPIVLQCPRAWDLPDMPATPENLESGCYRCCLRFRLPAHEDWQTIPAVNLGGWSSQQGPLDACDPCDPPLRKRCLAFPQSFVIFTCDLDLPKFLDACLSEPLVVEVHDRDAKPVELKIAMPKEPFPEPPPAPPDPIEEPPAQSAKADKVCPALPYILLLPLTDTLLTACCTEGERC